MRVLLLFLLTIPTFSRQYQFEDAFLRIESVSKGHISSSDSLVDQCGKAILRNKNIYHLSNQGIYQVWNIENLQNSSNTLNLSSSQNSTVLDFEVSPDEHNLAFLQNQPQNRTDLYYQNTDTSLTINSIVNYTQNPTRIFASHPYLYQYYSLFPYSNESFLHKKNFHSFKIQKNATFSSNFTSIEMSSELMFTALWDDQSNCQFYTTSSLKQINLFTPNNTPPYPSTDKITFSLDQKLAIIETDMFNPIVIIELTSFTAVNQIFINDTIYQAQFLDSNNSILVIFCQQALIFVDLNTNKQYPIPRHLATLYTSDHQNNIYTCSNNTLTKYNIVFNKIINTNKQDDQEATFYYEIDNQDQKQKEMMQNINKTLELTTQIVNYFANVISSTPITIYFLGFLNYMSTSSLYILLNFPIPDQVYRYLSFLYNKLNQDIFNVLNIELNVGLFSEQRVNRARPLFFSVSSDILHANFSGFLVFGFNLLSIVFASYLFSKIFTKVNFIKILFMRQKKKITFGIFFNLMQSLIIPWTFILALGGARNISSKLNLSTYIILLGICLLVQIFYMLELLFQENQKKYQKKQMILKRQTKLQRKLREISQIKQKKQSNKNFSSLLTNEILNQWFLCFTNFIFPLLVLVQDPRIFLVFILIHDISGLMLALYRKRRRVNSTMLSLYPLIFHICFMVFYWCTSIQVVDIGQIVCLITLLAGFTHNLLNIIFQIGQIIIKIIGLCKNNQIKPQVQRGSILNQRHSKGKTHELARSSSQSKKKDIKKVRFRLSDESFQKCDEYQQQRIINHFKITLDMGYEKSRFQMKSVRQKNLRKYLFTKQKIEYSQAIQLDQLQPELK